jgi:hypothetical protein
MFHVKHFRLKFVFVPTPSESQKHESQPRTSRSQNQQGIKSAVAPIVAMSRLDPRDRPDSLRSAHAPLLRSPFTRMRHA